MKILKYEGVSNNILLEVDENTLDSSEFRKKGIDSQIEQQLDEVTNAGMFDKTIGRIEEVGNAFAKSFGNMTSVPDSAEIEFALKFNSDVGVIIAKAGAEAQIKVKLSWSSQSISN